MLQNFPLFSEKSTASLICTSVWLLYSRPCHLLIMQPIFLVQGQCYRQLQQTLSLIDHATNIFGPRSVLQANLSNKINFGSDPGIHLQIPKRD